jgi:hypothetical protein
MSRTLSTAVSDVLDDDVVYPFFAVELLFDGDEVLRMWTGLGTLVYDSVSWYGAGNLLGVSNVEETSEIAAKGATLTLTAVPSEIISLALTQPYQGRVCNIYFGMFSRGSLQQEGSEAYILMEDGSKIMLELRETGLTEIFTGYMDQMIIEEGPDSSTIQLAVENRLVDLERARVARYTSAYQKSKYPTDLGFDFVESLQDQKLVWGRSVG